MYLTVHASSGSSIVQGPDRLSEVTSSQERVELSLSVPEGDKMSWIAVWTNRAPSASGYNGLTNNAEIVYDLLTNTYGWTHQAACGVIANLQSESAINPAQWQIGKTIGDWDDEYTGLGIGQWTPPSKIGDVVGRTQADYMDGDAQVAFLVSNEGQYSTYYLNPDGTSSYYGMSGLPYLTSIAQFSQSTASVQSLAAVWAICWERPRASTAHIDTRQRNASYWVSAVRITCALHRPVSSTA